MFSKADEGAGGGNAGEIHQRRDELSPGQLTQFHGGRHEIHTDFRLRLSLRFFQRTVAYVSAEVDPVEVDLRH